jgi:hypothetical protein
MNFTAQYDFTKMYIALEPISTAHFINRSHQSVCVYVYVARQRLSRNATTASNKRTATDVLDVPFSMRSMS